jgi:amino acid transporter
LGFKFIVAMDEKHGKNGIVSGPDSSSGSPDYSSNFGDDYNRTGLMNRVVDSFRRDPNVHATPKGAVGADGKVFDVENAAAATAESPLARKLKGRHLQMIAIGGSIGTSRLEGVLDISGLADSWR